LSLRLPDQTIHIDPRYHGNFGRFLNHSCDPNCVIHIVRWGGGKTWPRAAIFVRHDMETYPEDADSRPSVQSALARSLRSTTATHPERDRRRGSKRRN
jgi:hypothetical protein